MPRFIPAQSWLKISLIALVLLLLPASLSVSARELAGPLFSIPADPSDLAATADSGTQITLNWTDNSSNEDGFHIERSDDGLSGWTEIGDVAAEVTTYQDTTLSCGTQYFYRAFARNVDGDSTPSNVADDTTNACPTPPNAPSGLTATADSGTQITLNWTDNSSDEATFHIERSLDGSTGWTEIDSVAADVTTYQNTALSCGTPYYYHVFVRNAAGDSSPTSVASDTTFDCDLIVNTTSDTNDGNCNGAHCSLREAIIQANANAGADIITFNIPGGGVKTITLLTALPEITDPVTIDGLTQPGASCGAWPPTLLIEVTRIATPPFFDGLTISGGGSTIRGLVINGPFGNGIYLHTNGGNKLECNYIGPDTTGTTSPAFMATGIEIWDSPNNVIGGPDVSDRNLISGNSEALNITLATSSNTLIQGNYIGVTASGASALANPAGGIFVLHASGTVIRDNVIGGVEFGSYPMAISIATDNTASISDTVIQGNRIGTNAAGTAAIPNKIGIYIRASYNTVSNTVIGGSLPGEGNVISGNTDYGINIEIFSGATVPNLQITGNKIGTTADGNGALPNGSSGSVNGGIRSTAGGVQINGNLIANHNSNAGDFGILTNNATLGASSNNCVIGNNTGFVNNTATALNFANNWWGDATGPTIASNLSGLGQSISGVGAANVTYSPFLTTPPAACSFLYPAAPSGLTATTDSGTQITLNWTDNSSDEATFHIERSLDGSTGWTEIGSVSANVVTYQDTSAACATTYYYRVSASSSEGASSPSNVDSGTTYPCGDTFVVNSTSDVDDGACDTDHCSLREAIIGSNTLGGTQWIHFDIPGSAPYVITPSTALPNITQQVYLDAASQPGYSGVPLVVISGQNTLSVGLKLTNTANNSWVRGFVINGFSTYGLHIQGSSNTIQGNYIGTNTAGSSAVPNGVGIFVDGSTGGGNGNLIGGGGLTEGNVVSGNSGDGLKLVNVVNNNLQRNQVGLKANSDAALPNGGAGISINGGPNYIGSVASTTGNTIAGNAGPGLLVTGAGNSIRSNMIGVGPDSGASVPNAGGIQLQTASNTVLTDNTIGFSTGPSGYGLDITSSTIATSSNNCIFGNTVGVDTHTAAALTFNNNWWGDASGPSGVGPGSGDSIMGIGAASVIYSPFLTVRPACDTRPVSFVVNTTNDSVDGAGCDAVHCSLREAITAANVSIGLDTITFNIPGPNPHTIQITNEELPPITKPLKIDGRSQPGYSGTPVIVLNGSLLPMGSALGVEASHTTIQGLVINEFDVCCNPALYVSNYNTILTDVTIIGNYIGTDATGMVSKPNAVGISISSTNSVVGGTNPEDGNLISSNQWHGLRIANGYQAETGVLVIGNKIGTDITGTQPMGNGGSGLFITGYNHIVGGTSPGEANMIANNGLGGIVMGAGVFGETGNRLSGNSIYNNELAGIALSGNDYDLAPVTPNDPGDADDGTNHLQNYPVLMSVANNGGSLDINGTLDSLPNQTYQIEFFSNTECDPSGFGEGKTYLGAIDVTTDGAGSASVSASFPGALPTGSYVTTTATHPDGSTSEFSHCAGLIMGSGPATFVVTSKNDVNDGVCNASHCSLREAMIAANMNAGADTITFNIPGAAPYLIQPANPGLPPLMETVNIDGRTQPGYSGKPIIILDGTNVTLGSVSGLELWGGGSAVRGLVIHRFPLSGIRLAGGDGNIVQGNYLGTNAAGTAGMPINPEVTGSGAMSFGQIIDASSDSNQIGGLLPVERNVISGNWNSGISLGSDANVIQGNYIGPNAAGSGTVMTTTSSDTVYGNSVGITMEGSHDTIIGGTAPGAGNVISGNSGGGIWMGGEGTIVQGNLIGTNAAGTAKLGLGNGQHGIVTGGTNGGPNIIGGTEPGARNVISGSEWYGIMVVGYSPTGSGNIIQGNTIGSDITGTKAIANGSGGIALIDRANFNLIGGTEPGSGNLIAFNGGPGVTLQLLVSDNGLEIPYENSILGNLIHSNGGPDIDLGANGYTSNDTGDADDGENTLQNYPSLDSVEGESSSAMALSHAMAAGVEGAEPSSTQALATETRINGHFNSTPNQDFRLEFFSTNVCDAGGYGQAKARLGSTDVTTDSSGNASFSVLVPLVPSGQFITSTATDEDGNTSEFGFCLAAPKTPTAPVLTGPVNKFVTNDQTPTLSWGAASDAASYEIQIDNTSSFAVPITQTGTSTGLSYTTATLPAGTHYWRVRGINSYGAAGAWSAARSFTIDITPPAVPNLSNPAHNSIVTTATPTLKVTSVSGANRYQFEVSTTSDFSGVVVDKTVTTTSTTATPALPFGVYYWRARALDAAGNTGNWSAVRSFTYTLLNLPADASFTTDTTPAFKWKSMSGATGWHLQVDNNSDFSSPEVDHTVGAAILTYSPPSALGFGLYYWKLQVNSASGWSIWMPTRTVTVSPAYPAAPALTGPANGFKTNDNTPTLTWNSVATGDHYQIQIATNSSFTTLVQDVTLGSGVLTFTPPALSDGTKYWRVRALNVYNAPGAWAAYRKVVIDATPPAVPVLNSPADNASTTDKTPALSVKSVSGANLYNFVVATDNAFTNILTDVNVSGTSYTPPTSYPVGPIYWKVRARDAVGNWSAFSAYRTLNIN